jgi:hypothetical protein
MTTRVSVLKCGLAIALTGVVTVAAAGCSKNTSSSNASSTASATTSATSSASSSAAASATASAQASARFVGHWLRHQSTLDITPTTASLFAGLGNGPCSEGVAACSEIDTFSVTSGDDTHLVLTVTDVQYVLKDGQKTSVNPSPGPVTAAGDAIQLVWREPGILKQTVVKGFPGWQGDLDWCGTAGTPIEKQGCGA